MVKDPKKATADDSRLALQVKREENNFEAAARGAGFSIRLAFNRLMDRASWSKPRSDEGSVECASSTHPRYKRALLWLGSVSTLWIALSPRARAYLDIVARIIFHMWKAAAGH